MKSKRVVLLMGSMLLGGSVIVLYIIASGCCIPYEEIEVDGVMRRYLLHVPDRLPPDQSVPLVLALHQFSDTPRGMRLMTRLDGLADREGFMVVYPAGRYRKWDIGADPRGMDHRFLMQLIDLLTERYPIDDNRIYATGASAGAMMIQSLACHTDRLAAIAPVMGSLPREIAEACSPSTNLPVLVIHGLEDPVIPYEGGRGGGPSSAQLLSAEETAAFWARANGCLTAPTMETQPIGRDADSFVHIFRFDCPPPGEVLLYAVSQCGHSWPGHKSRYPGCIVGPSVPDLSATEIIWEFFKRHPRQ